MVTLNEIADRAMKERGFIIDFPPEVVHQLEKIHEPAKPEEYMQDLRNLFWVSIDNDDSKDLDQLTYCEGNKVFVAVSDVDEIVKKHSPIDNYADHNTTSIYTPNKNYPMLPLKLSTNLTSLNPDQDRIAIVVEMEVKRDGEIVLNHIYRALVRNQAKLAYNGVAAFLTHTGPLPIQMKGLAEQLRLQDQLARDIKHHRYQEGALGFVTQEVQPIVVNGVAVELKERVSNRAHAIIENFMIAANICISHYFVQKKMSTLRRIVRVPKRWDRIIELARPLGTNLPPEPDAKALRDFLLKEQHNHPDTFSDLSLAVIKLIGRGEYVLWKPEMAAIGHFNLALMEYAHTTAPNRRYPDLVMQRILKSQLDSRQRPYTNAELDIIAQHCTDREDAATKLERQVLKSAAAMVMAKEIGHTYKVIVTGCTPSGTWVRLYKPPIEGKLVEGCDGIDVGDKITVKLIHVDIEKGHIDFKRVS